MTTSDAIEQVCKKYSLPVTTGGSGKGWSYFATLQRCPKAFELTYIRKVNGHSDAKALEIGTSYHAFLACYYRSLISNGQTLSAEEMKDELNRLEVNAEYLTEAWRIYQAYEAHYQDDYLEPLVVEESARDPSSGLTCRYDLIARITVENPLGLKPGIYDVEHKSTSRLAYAASSPWDMDGEILGQIMLWQKAGLVHKFGPLQGVIVNVASKTKVPEMERLIVNPESAPYRRHWEDLRQWQLLEGMFRRTMKFPRSLSGCQTRYGQCSYFDFCRIGEVPSHD